MYHPGWEFSSELHCIRLQILRGALLCTTQEPGSMQHKLLSCVVYTVDLSQMLRHCISHDGHYLT